MARRDDPRTRDLRRRIAIEAARVMSESGIRDHRLAKEKAAHRLGVFEQAALPTNLEVDDALREHQRIFQADEQPRVLRALRESAREAMRFFAAFEPRLVGAVLDGSADRHSAVCLHLYTDRPDEAAWLLRERAIPFDEDARRLRVEATSAREFPVVRFTADGTPIDVTLLPFDLLRQAPLDRISERPMQRATLATLESLLSAAAAARPAGRDD